MAAAIAVPTMVLSKDIGNFYEVIGTLAISASPATYVTGGIVLNFFQNDIKATSKPVMVVVVGIAGYEYRYVAGTDASNGLLEIYVQDAVATNPLAQFGNGTAIAAGISGDTITFRATWAGMK